MLGSLSLTGVLSTQKLQPAGRRGITITLIPLLRLEQVPAVSLCLLFEGTSSVEYIDTG